MKLSLRALGTLPLLCALFALAPLAHANTISGTAYCGIPSNTGGNGSGFAIQTPTQGAQLAAAISGSQGVCATFTASNLNFATNSGAGSASHDTLAGFLNSFGATTSVSYLGTGLKATGAESFDGTLLVLDFSSFLQNGQTITLKHDDGINIYMDGSAYLLAGMETVANQPDFTFLGTTGVHSFEVIYNSNYTAPAVLKSNLADIAATPEPSTFVLLGTGMLSAAGVLRRHMRS